MNILILFFFTIIIPLVILFVFSIFIINSALNKKNIKLDLFAFHFDFDKLRRKVGYSEQIANEQVALEEVTEPQPTEIITAIDTATERTLQSLEKQNIAGENSEEHLPNEQMESFSENAFSGDIPSEFGDLSAFDDIDASDKKDYSIADGIKDRFARIQHDASVRAIEREEKRLQDDFEMYDPDEIPEEIPEDIGGKLKYWWRNHIGFRIGTCTLAIFLIFVMVFYGFQMRNRIHNDKQQTEITNNEKDEKEKEDKGDLSDSDLDAFRQGLDEELSPVDVAAGSMDEDPNLAEIIATAQSDVGETPASYSGSSTKSQPSGSIGTISIPSINLSNAPVMGSVAMSDLSKGTGHFENTPVFDGNVGIAGHNNTHFKYLVNVDIGDQIQYTVDGVTRTYEVTDMRAISDTDWGVFTDHGDNRLTLVTCEHLVPESRIAVTAVQVGSDAGTAKAPAVYKGKKNNTSYWQDSGDYHDAGSGYTDYIGVYTGNN